MRECETDKINPASKLFDAPAVCDEHQPEVLEFVNFIRGFTTKYDGLALLARDERWHHLGL